MRNKDRAPSDRVAYKFSLFLLLLMCTRGISSQCFVLCDSYTSESLFSNNCRLYREDGDQEIRGAIYIHTYSCCSYGTYVRTVDVGERKKIGKYWITRFRSYIYVRSGARYIWFPCLTPGFDLIFSAIDCLFHSSDFFFSFSQPLLLNECLSSVYRTRLTFCQTARVAEEEGHWFLTPGVHWSRLALLYEAQAEEDFFE
jgi:hypothetical protein